MATTSSGGRSTGIILGIIAIVLALGAVLYVLSQDNRSSGERVVDAIEAVPQGIDSAAGQLEDKSPAENIGDNVDRAVDRVN